MAIKQHKYVIEHMEPEFSDWVKLEYLQIQRDVGEKNFWLSSVPADVQESDLPTEFIEAGLQWSHTDINNFQEVDAAFTGDSSRVCLLDPSAEKTLSPEDSDKFDWFLFGGILGDHPPRDRTGELRKYGYVGRNLGKKQMTTDTAVRVTKIVCTEKSKYKHEEF